MTHLGVRYFSIDKLPETKVVVARHEKSVFIDVHVGMIETSIFREPPELVAWLTVLRDQIDAAIIDLSTPPAAPAPAPEGVEGAADA